MEFIELISECIPYVLSIVATVVAFTKNKKTLTAEEIEAKAEEKKQKILIKLNKKNHIKSGFQDETVKVAETCTEDNSTGYTAL